MKCWNRLRTWGVLGLVLAIAGIAQAADPLGYYRYPTVYGDKVVFTAEGDLWEAPLAGGMAHRLTIAPGEERFAMFSPDGRWIAFSGNYDGNVDVYVIPVSGGEPKRLTYHPDGDWVAAWTPDGKIAFRSFSHSGPGTAKCFTISPEGGYPEVVAVDEAAHITFEPKGDRIAYTRISRTGATWKRYKGGLADQIWVGSTKSHDYARVHPDNVGHEAIPMWHGDRIYFLRDNDARMNIHSMKPDGSDIQQHTFHEEWDARWPTLSQGKIAYSLGADIWVYDIAANESKMVRIMLPSDRMQARDKFISPDEYTNEFELSPDGKRLMIGARGELFTAPTERRGIIKQLTRTNGAREKGASYLPNGESVLAWSDIGGEEALYLYPVKKSGEPKKVAEGKGGWNYPAEIAPDGKWAVYGDNHRRLQLVNLESGATSEIDTSAWEIRDYEWSPDSRYIAYGVTLPSDFSAIRIYDTKEKKAHTVTDALYSSYSPTWDPKGKWLYFISSRFINPFTAMNDWSFVSLAPDGIYGLALAKDTKDPYAYTEDGTAAEDEKDDDGEDDNGDNGDDEDKDKKKDKNAKKDDDKDADKDKDDDKKDEKVTVKIDWDGLEQRVIELDVKPGDYRGLTAIEGKLYFFSFPMTGWRSSAAYDEDDLKATLHLYDIKKKKNSKVVKGAQGYTLSGDRKKIAVRKKGEFVVMDAGATDEPEKDDHDEDAGLHLEDWIFDVDPSAEWRQIFNEAWRLQRDFFYDPNMHGIDWKAQREHYAMLLDRVSTRGELNDLIGQMISELNAGHAYIGGGDGQSGKSVSVGLLGVDVSRDKSGFYRIDKVLTCDSWDEERTSPLACVGVNAKEGDYIVAIDDRPVNTVDSYLKLLIKKAGKPVAVSLNSKPSLDGARKVVVKAMESEWELRYWDWVRGRMEYVKKHGGEEIAYVHLSDMGTNGLEQWMKEYYPQAQKPALIMDVRYNGGGNIAEWILSELQRTVWSWGTARNGQRYHRPSSAFYGHMIALCNEETGSDGETFSEGFKRLKLGPLVGKRTWGGWVGIRGDKPFMDRGYYTQPEFTGWGKESTWLIEGPGVYPDVDLENHPKQMMNGVDEQLDYAIKYLKDKLKNEPVINPAMPPFPVKTPTGYKQASK